MFVACQSLYVAWGIEDSGNSRFVTAESFQEYLGHNSLLQLVQLCLGLSVTGH